MAGLFASIPATRPTMASADIAAVQEQLKTQASEAIRTRELLQMLSKQKLPAKALPWLKPDLTPKNQGDGIVLREATSLASTIRSKSGSLVASDLLSLEMPMDAASQAQFQAQLQSEWQDSTAVALGAVSVQNRYENSSCLRKVDGRQGTFLYLKTWGQAANQSLWMNVA